jgi:signal transduction histidine kinase
MKSIQRRLSLGLLAVLLVVGLLLAQTSLWLFELGLRRYLEVGLRNDAESLLVSIARSPTGLQLDSQRLTPNYERPLSGSYFHVEAAGQVWRSRSLWDHELAKPAQPGLQAALVAGPQAQQLLVLRGDYRRFGQPLSITVAQDYSPLLSSFRQVQYLGLGLGLGALLLVLGLQRLTVRNALRPLEQARQQIAQLHDGQRAQLDTQVPQELEPLVAQINHLLNHTSDTLSRSRHALGNLGHALKTPLAVLLSLAGREELNAYPELQTTLREQLAQINQRLARELARARLSGEVLPGAQFDCANELPGLFSTLALIHPRGLQLSWQAAPGLRLPWDREDLLEVLGNLLDNACKWAATRVQLHITVADGCYCLRVDDDGPGIAAANRAAVLERGTRLDEQVAGHGLGLGVVRDCVQAWAGRLELQDSPLGGLRVLIELRRSAKTR